MTKLFKCPECGAFLHTLHGFIECTKHYNHNIDKDGAVIPVGESDSQHGTITYECSECNHCSENQNDFIADIECDCEHLESGWTLYQEHDYDICQRCGLVIDTEYTPDVR